MQTQKRGVTAPPEDSSTYQIHTQPNIHGFPFTVTLVRYPGGEVRYRERINIPPKRDGRQNEYKYSVAEEDRVRIQDILREEENTQSTSETQSERDLLDNSPEFHDSRSRHSKQGRPGYGALPDREHRFSRYGRNSVRWSACTLEERFGRENCIFLTATCPGSSDRAVKAFAEWSSWTADRVQKWLRDNFSQAADLGLSELHHVYVWEFQRRGALHYHGLVVTSDYERLNDLWQPFWVELLKQGSELSGVDWFERRKGGSWKGFGQVVQVDCQITQKSVASYLAKYLGKGATEGGRACPEKLRFPPARYWGRTRNVRRLVLQVTKQYELPPMSSEDVATVRSLVESYFQERAEYSARTVIRLKERDESGTEIGHRDLYLGCVGWFGVLDYESPLELAEIIAAHWGDNWLIARERYKNYHSATNRYTSEVSAKSAALEALASQPRTDKGAWEPPKRRTLAQWVKYLRETY